jgi:hypothetical protein
MMLTAKRVEWAETNAKLKVVPAVGGAVDWDWGHRHFNRSESFLSSDKENILNGLLSCFGWA